MNSGLEVRALHNHFFYDTLRIFYMDVHGRGRAADLAGKVAPAIAMTWMENGTFHALRRPTGEGP